MAVAEPDFIAPPREGFPSILGLWISSTLCMCERVGLLVECMFMLEDGLPPRLQRVRIGTDLISSVVNTCGSLFM